MIDDTTKAVRDAVDTPGPPEVRRATLFVSGTPYSVGDRLRCNGNIYEISADEPRDGDLVITENYGVWEYRVRAAPLPYWSGPCKKLVLCAESASFGELTCGKCGGPGEEPHPCAYDYELSDGEYYETCTCCGACERECYADV